MMYFLQIFTFLFFEKLANVKTSNTVFLIIAENITFEKKVKNVKFVCKNKIKYSSQILFLNLKK